MQLEKYKIEESNQQGLQDHKRKFEFVASSVRNLNDVLQKTN